MLMGFDSFLNEITTHFNHLYLTPREVEEADVIDNESLNKQNENLKYYHNIKSLPAYQKMRTQDS